SRCRAGARAVLLGAAGRQAAAIARQHVQGAEGRPRLSHSEQRLPGAVGRAGGAAPERGADGASARAGVTRQQGLGDVHRRDHQGRQRPRRPDGVRPVGRLRAEEGKADRRQQAHDPEGGSSVAVVGEEVPRQPPLLGDQRRPEEDGQGPNRLANPQYLRRVTTEYTAGYPRQRVAEKRLKRKKKKTPRWGRHPVGARSPDRAPAADRRSPLCWSGDPRWGTVRRPCPSLLERRPSVGAGARSGDRAPTGETVPQRGKEEPGGACQEPRRNLPTRMPAPKTTARSRMPMTVSRVRKLGDRTIPGGAGVEVRSSGAGPGSRWATPELFSACVPQPTGGDSGGLAPTVAPVCSFGLTGSNNSSKSLRSNNWLGCCGPCWAPVASGLGTTTCPEQVGQRTTVPALRRAIPMSWLQYAQRKRI